MLQKKLETIVSCFFCLVSCSHDCAWSLTSDSLVIWRENKMCQSTTGYRLFPLLISWLFLLIQQLLLRSFFNMPKYLCIICLCLTRGVLHMSYTYSFLQFSYFALLDILISLFISITWSLLCWDRISSPITETTSFLCSVCYHVIMLIYNGNFLI